MADHLRRSTSISSTVTGQNTERGGIDAGGQPDIAVGAGL